MYATTVTRNDELVQIHELNLQNLKWALSEEERRQEGFLSWLYRLDLLQQMHQLAPSVVAKDGDRVIGYALTAFVEAAAFHPDLQAMLQHLGALEYRGKKLSDWSFYV